MEKIQSQFGKILENHKKKKELLQTLWNEQKYIELYEIMNNFKYRRKIEKIQKQELQYEVGSNQKFSSYLFLLRIYYF